jgi:hypothetical protein
MIIFILKTAYRIIHYSLFTIHCISPVSRGCVENKRGCALKVSASALCGKRISGFRTPFFRSIIYFIKLSGIDKSLNKRL